MARRIRLLLALGLVLGATGCVTYPYDGPRYYGGRAYDSGYGYGYGYSGPRRTVVVQRPVYVPRYVRRDRHEWREDRREWRQDRRADRREWRQDRRHDRKEWRQDRRHDRREHRNDRDWRRRR